MQGAGQAQRLAHAPLSTAADAAATAAPLPP